MLLALEGSSLSRRILPRDAVLAVVASTGSMQCNHTAKLHFACDWFSDVINIFRLFYASASCCKMIQRFLARHSARAVPLSSLSVSPIPTN